MIHTHHTQYNIRTEAHKKAICRQCSCQDRTSEIRRAYARGGHVGAAHPNCHHLRKGDGDFNSRDDKRFFSPLYFVCFVTSFFFVKMAVTNLGCKLPRKWRVVPHQAAGLAGRGTPSTALKRRDRQAETYTWKREKENQECSKQLDSPFPIILFMSCP